MEHFYNQGRRKMSKKVVQTAAIITHAAMYVGWPKGWAVFRLAKEVWKDEKE